MSAVIVLSPTFQALVQVFFTSYLVDQRAVSPRTVTTYRDAFTLLLEHAEHTLGKAPAALTLVDINETLILGFLDELETRRGNAVRTRNARLAAIRSFLQFATRRDGANLATTTAALSVPMKRFERPMLGFLFGKHRQACARLARARRRTSRQRAATANAPRRLHDASERRAATRDRGEARD